MNSIVPLDKQWLAAHPIAPIDPEIDKNTRGRALVVGGARFVPGALRLSGEAALRSGAGKLQLATVDSLALQLGVLVPEAAMVALPSAEDGEIDSTASRVLKTLVSNCDALILGPGMSQSAGTELLVHDLLAEPREDLSVLLDAAALTCATSLVDIIASHRGRVVMTPHLGELAHFRDIEEEIVSKEPAGWAHATAAQYRAVVILKGPVTYLATPAGDIFALKGECPALATSGSGDVLAGIAGGLLARGAEPVTAAGWAIWVHNQAGRKLSEETGVGFLARELLSEIPTILRMARK
jgi:ADP-dependent NAD(P)H-hydrate dehydratase